MKLPRDLSGRQLAQTLTRHFGYREVNRVGSHIILQTDTPKHHRVSVPDHHPVRIGTLNAFFVRLRRPRMSAETKFCRSFSEHAVAK